MRFIKIYDGSEDHGYISAKDIVYFAIEYNEGDYDGDQHFIIIACEENDKLEDGYIVSPRIFDYQEAKDFLESLIERLR